MQVLEILPDDLSVSVGDDVEIVDNNGRWAWLE
jgi:hypothetical protein